LKTLDFKKTFGLPFWARLYYQNVILRTPKSHPLIDLENSRFQKDFWFIFLDKDILSKCDFENTKKSPSD